MSRHIVETRPSTAATLVAVDGRTYPLEQAELVARAECGIATTSLVQTFANPYNEALELTYTLPLPADGAVLGYTIRIGEKTIRAEVQPREQASQAYRDALFQGRTAGLLEQTRPDTFQQKLGNVPARTKVEIMIDVLHPLAFVFARGLGGFEPGGPRIEEGRDCMPSPAFPSSEIPHWEYRFPTVVGVRYHGAPGRVADHAELSPDRGDTPTRVSLTLTVADATGDSAQSPSHAIDTAHGEGGSLIRFREGERLNRDVVVRWLAAAEAVGARVVEGSGLAGDDGRYALVTLVPPAVTTGAFHRDLTVLLDTSGSMSGQPLDLAKRLVGELVNSLEEGDRFELLEFSNDVRRFTRGLLKVTPDTVRKAHEWLARLQADGGTEMAQALEEALRSERKDAQRQVVLVTDGEISFETEVVAKAAAAQNVRLHVVGVGHCPNRALTQQAAAAGRGLELLVGDESSATSAAARLVTGTARPVLTHVSVQGTAVVGEQREWLRDVFAGQPLLVTVELGSRGGTLEVRGDLAGSAEPWVQRIAVPAAGEPGALSSSPLPLGALHGRLVVGELEIRRNVMGHGESIAIDQRIEAFGMRHRIATRRTSLIAIEETPSVDPRQPSRRVKLAVELPAGVSAEGAGLELAAAMGGSSMLMYGGQAMMMSTGAPVRARKAGLGLGDRIEKLIKGGFPPFHAVEITASDVRWLGPNVLIVEFVTPHDDFMLPQGDPSIAVRTKDGHTLSVRGPRVEAESSPEGPHPAGMVVRLAIRIGMIPRWKAESDVTMTWIETPDGFDGHTPIESWAIDGHAPERPQAVAK